MTDLTEQWKKGELPSGEYYIIDDLGLHTTDRYYPSHGFGAELPQFVLGKVPSYDEWQAKLEENARLKERVSKLEKMQYSYTPEEWNTMLRTVNRTREENAQLKELLARAKGIITAYRLTGNQSTYSNDNMKEYVAKIDEVLK